MKLQLRTVREGYDGHSFWTQSRIGACGDLLVLTSQQMFPDANDYYGLVHTCFSEDGGESWSSFVPQQNLEMTDIVLADLAPQYHTATGKLLATGKGFCYLPGERRPARNMGKHGFYTVFDPATRTFCPPRRPQLPDGTPMMGHSFGCSRRCDLPNGDILLPSAAPGAAIQFHRFTFDGTTLTCVESGDTLCNPEEKRGYAEPSLASFQGKFYATLRADSKGYVTVSDDGLHFAAPRPWCWDSGLEVPTFNTQQNWVITDSALYLVYTRRDGKNEHVFRCRAPLYMAQVDTERLCLLRHTEIALTPERGARCGNFGVTPLAPDHHMVVTTEWMQPAGCERFGSNNAIFIADLQF